MAAGFASPPFPALVLEAERSAEILTEAVVIQGVKGPVGVAGRMGWKCGLLASAVSWPLVNG